MSALEEKLRAFYWFYKKLRLFGEPVFFVVIVVLTALGSGQIFLDSAPYTVKASFLIAVLKAATSYLAHHSVGVEICFSITWICHWVYFWKKMKEWLYYTSVSWVPKTVSIASIASFILIPLFLIGFQPNQISPNALELKRVIHQLVQISLGFLFPFILTGNVCFWLVEMYEDASDQVYEMVEKETRKMREAAREAPVPQPESKPQPQKIKGGERVLL